VIQSLFLSAAARPDDDPPRAEAISAARYLQVGTGSKPGNHPHDGGQCTAMIKINIMLICEFLQQIFCKWIDGATPLRIVRPFPPRDDLAPVPALATVAREAR
jgi:hypothetical protein